MLAVLLVGEGGSSAFVWHNYEELVREVVGWEVPDDVPGSGNGDEAGVTIASGVLSDDVARKLHDADVTADRRAMADLALNSSTEYPMWMRRWSKWEYFGGTSFAAPAFAGMLAVVNGYRRSLGLPRDAPFHLFALGRSVGWAAHMVEQIMSGSIIRPRGRYEGLLP